MKSQIIQIRTYVHIYTQPTQSTFEMTNMPIIQAIGKLLFMKSFNKVNLANGLIYM